MENTSTPSKQYDDNNRGPIYKNDRKEKDSDPDYKGSLNVEGVEYWVAIWVNTSKSGMKYMSQRITKKDAPATPKTATVQDVTDEDIPF